MHVVFFIILIDDGLLIYVLVFQRKIMIIKNLIHFSSFAIVLNFNTDRLTLSNE